MQAAIDSLPYDPCVGVSTGGPVSRSVVGLLAAVAAALSALVGLAHGDLVAVTIAGAGTAGGLAAYLALPPQKKGYLAQRLR